MPRVAFLGTPEVALPSLRALTSIADVAVVVSRPDKPRGRSGKPRPSPVASEARSLGLQLAAPERSSQLSEVLEAHGPLDAAVVVAFGMLIRPAALAVPRHGHLNLHFSLLPRWRGAAPVQRAIMAGDERIGISLFRLDEGLDTGPVLAMRSTRLGPEETGGEVLARLARSGADLLAEVLVPYLDGEVIPVRQASEGVTLAPRIEPEERRLDLSLPSRVLSRQVNALSPRPGAYAFLDEEPFRLLRARSVEGRSEPGRLALDEGRLLAGTGEGRLELVEVQPAGKKPMDGVAWARGRHGDLGRLA